MPEDKNLDLALVTHIHNSANYMYYRRVSDFILLADFDQDYKMLSVQYPKYFLPNTYIIHHDKI